MRHPSSFRSLSAVMCFVAGVACARAQTLYVPGGTTSGIGNNTTNGNVGIGTSSSPGEKLQVKGNVAFESANTSVFRIVPEPSTNDRILQFENGSSASTGGFAFKATDGAFNTVRFKINNNGNVGIGTASPEARFELSMTSGFVSNKPTARILHYNYPAGGQTNVAAFQILNGNTSSDSLRHGYLSLEQVFTGAATDSPVLYFAPRKNASNEQEWWGWQGVGGSRLRLLYSTTASGIGPAASPSEFVSISNLGNVGIGTTGPGGKLQITSADVGSVKTYSTSSGFGLILDQYYSGASEQGASYTRTADIVASTGDVSSSQIRFLTKPANSSPSVAMLISGNGNVGIGTSSPTQKLSVNGTIRAKEVIVEASPWPDDVFEAGYKLKALSEVAAHIEEEGHLPDVPSAATVAEQGMAVGEMQKTLLRKIEELTLYAIEQRNISEEQEKRLAAATARIDALERENAALRAVRP